MALPAGAAPPSGYQWAEYFEDQFTTLDTSLWYRYHNTYGDGGQREDYLRPENLVADGTLKVVTKRETYETRDFTSGFLSTGKRGTAGQPEPAGDTFFPRAGFFEMRAKVSQAQGLLPAFWLRHRGGAGVAEVDIMEMFHSQVPGRTNQTLHLNNVTNIYKTITFLQATNTVPEWHTWGVSILGEGSGVRFRFYLDGTETGTYLATATAFWDDYPDPNLWDISVNTHTGGVWVGHPDDPLGYDRYRDACLQGGTPPSCDSTDLVRAGISNLHPSPYDEVYEVDYVRVWTLEESSVAEQLNDLECGSDETAITPANSGCGSNTPFVTDSAVTWGGAVYDTARSVNGVQSGRFSATADSGGSCGYATSPTDPYGRVHLYMTANPPAPARFAQMLNVSTLVLMLRVLADGSVAVTDSGFTNRGTSTPLALNTWHRIEWKATTGTSTAGLVEVRIFSGANVNGTTPDQTITSTSMTLGAWDKLGFGVMFSSSQTYSWWLDDVGLSDSTWLGPAQSLVALDGVIAGSATAVGELTVVPRDTWVDGLLNVSVELFYDGVWNPIPCNEVDVSDEITMQRGRADLQDSPSPSRCTLKLDNTGGKYTPRNARSPLFGKIGKNTPLRVSVDTRVRFCGEVSSWPTRWEVEGYAWVEVEAYGIRRRLSQGAPVLQSTMFRAITSRDSVAPIAYWPCEDGSDSSRFASAIGGRDMTVGLIPGFPTRDVRFAAYSDFVSSDSIPELSVTSVVGSLPVNAATGEVRVVSLLHVPDGGVGAVVEILTLRAGGSATEFGVQLDAAGSLRVVVRDREGGNIYTGVWFARAVNGKRNLFGLHLTQVGSNIDVDLFLFEEFSNFGVINSNTVNNRTFGSLRQVLLGKTGDLKGTAMGHVAVYNEDTANAIWPIVGQVLDGYIGEPAVDRMKRLSLEENIVLSVDTLARSEKMGFQRSEATLELLDQCAATDQGILSESRDTCAFLYRPRVSLYNQAPLELDYCQVSNPFEPTDDDQYLVNDMTVERDGGGSARAIKQTGVLSVEDAGRFGDSVTLSLNSDGQATNQATWRLHLGTVDESRYPQLHVSLYGNSEITPEVLGRVTALDIGDRVTITNLPGFLAEQYADLIVQGYTETTDGMRWDFTFNCTPASPWTVGVAEDTVLGRADTAGSELTEAVDSTQTSFEVATTRGPEWVKDAVEFPFDVKMGGEEVTVTSIADAVVDEFNRTVSSGWGTSDSGHVWVTEGGSPSDYSVDGSQGLIEVNSLLNNRVVSTSSFTDVNVAATISCDVVASGDTIFVSLMARYVDIGNVYFGQLDFLAGGTLGCTLARVSGGVVTNLDNVTVGTYTAGEKFNIRLVAKGGWLKAKVWQAVDSEPVGWTVRAMDNTLSAGGVGVRTAIGGGLTNPLPVTIAVDRLEVVNPQTFTVTRSVNGIVKPHPAGTKVSLANPAVVAL